MKQSAFLELEGEDFELVKTLIGWHKTIHRANDIMTALDEAKIQSLSSPKVGWYHAVVDYDDYCYVECSCCGTDLPELGQEEPGDVDMVNNALNFDFPNFCPNCGAKMGVALAPSEYLSYIEYEGKEEAQKAFKKKVEIFCYQKDVDPQKFSNFKELLLFLDSYKEDDEGKVLFDLDGDLIRLDGEV